MPLDGPGQFREVVQGLHARGGPDALEQVLRSADDGDHVCAVLPGPFQFGDRAGDGAGQGVQPVALGEQPAVMAPQGLQLVHLGGQDPADLGQTQGQLPQHEDLLQPQQLALLVVAMAVGPDPGR